MCNKTISTVFVAAWAAAGMEAGFAAAVEALVFLVSLTLYKHLQRYRVDPDKADNIFQAAAN